MTNEWSDYDLAVVQLELVAESGELGLSPGDVLSFEEIKLCESFGWVRKNPSTGNWQLTFAGEIKYNEVQAGICNKTSPLVTSWHVLLWALLALLFGFTVLAGIGWVP